MIIKNLLLKESFQYSGTKTDYSQRSDDIYQLAELEDCCKQVGETIQYPADLYETEVEDGICLWEWLYRSSGKGNPEDRRLLLELLGKCKSSELEGYFDAAAAIINISLGVYGESAYDKKSYIEYRRRILASINNITEYCEFMPSCFLNSIFADDIQEEMRHIPDFQDCTEELTKNLSVLNDEALELYAQYRTNLKQAMDILSAKLLACSPDPAHRDSLLFNFTYEEIKNGENISRVKKIECSPHLKLIREDSNLRIYFYWCDREVGDGKKVLIGRIGRHPY